MGELHQLTVTDYYCTQEHPINDLVIYGALF